ncbi:hypothetical protein [Pollutimonas harenae]|uniref:Uncharacterized protein n=1 Tax=Pollutimonas harenae TaxID=657015 RepID=A0A853H1A5_9BURK|nr:hypothetical protein [Pollutimonas harenae]NYT85015.1 hypothetical protein [Pollutimonas harenae]TEA72599.1 hypothetical protein ERD84_01415 [Pollutimonas harenae]
MFGSIDKSKGMLFVTYDLSQSLQNTMQSLRTEVESLEANRLLNTAPEDLKNYLVEKYRVTPATLLHDQWYADSQEVQVDVRYDQRRWIPDTSRPVMIPGERIKVHVPFDGEADLFYSRANQFTLTPPRAIIKGSELVLQYDSPADSPSEVRPLIDRSIADIEQHLAWQRPMIEAHNSALPTVAEQAIQDRRNRLLAQSQRVEALGIPIKRRSDSPTTYAVPTTRRKAAPTLPPATTSQFKPEPIWAMEQYEQALKIMQDMALVMERSPEAFKSMDEEALRQHFLVQLNGQFEGKATGETFNMEGKTDILLREGDRNVFIAECKFWKGPKAFAQAIDQLMGYATWRDSKTVILVFNRGTDTSTVLSGIASTVKSHDNFKRLVSWPHESGFRYILHSNGDINREMTLTVLVFHVPK